jgi:flagellar motor switch protein FliM
VSRQLTQQEIDDVFRSLQERKSQEAPTAFFRRPDRIAKSQLRAIHLLHDTFVRNLVSSLSAFLRTYLTVNLVSVEQLSYAEFLEGLPSPTCLVSLGLRPYDGKGVLELNPSLVFPILEILLGGTGKASAPIHREITEIEQGLLDGLFRVILQDLAEAWKSVTVIDFTIEAVETEPQLLHGVALKESVVGIGIEIDIGGTVGMMNIAMPSIIVKMMRQKFDQQWSGRKSESTEAERARVYELARRATLHLDTRLAGPTLPVRELLQLQEGDVLTFDHPVNRVLDGLVNGRLKFKGRVVRNGRKRAFVIGEETSLHD